MLNFVMLGVIIKTEAFYYYYTECQFLNVVLLNAVMLNVVTQGVVAPKSSLDVRDDVALE